MRQVKAFWRDEAGAVTIDWVALTAGILLLGMAVVFAIFSGGVETTVADVNAELSQVTFITVGAQPDFSQ